jgi:hypothetical protein
MLDTSFVGPSFQAVEIDDHMRYCGPCGTQTDSHVLVVRPTSNGVKDGNARCAGTVARPYAPCA